MPSAPVAAKADGDSKNTSASDCEDVTLPLLAILGVARYDRMAKAIGGSREFLADPRIDVGIIALIGPGAALPSRWGKNSL